MELIKTIRLISKEHWTTATWVLGYAIIFGAAPIWISLIVNSFFGKASLDLFADNGQIVIFSAALLSSGFYFVGKDFKRTVFPGRLGFNLVSATFLILAVSIFTCIILINSGEISTPSINWATIRVWSYSVSILSFIIVYIAAAINEMRTQHHYKTSAYDKGTGKLENDFDRAGGIS